MTRLALAFLVVVMAASCLAEESGELHDIDGRQLFSDYRRRPSRYRRPYAYRPSGYRRNSYNYGTPNDVYVPSGGYEGNYQPPISSYAIPNRVGVPAVNTGVNTISNAYVGVPNIPQAPVNNGYNVPATPAVNSGYSVPATPVINNAYNAPSVNIPATPIVNNAYNVPSVNVPAPIVNNAYNVPSVNLPAAPPVSNPAPPPAPPSPPVPAAPPSPPGGDYPNNSNNGGTNPLLNALLGNRLPNLNQGPKGFSFVRVNRPEYNYVIGLTYRDGEQSDEDEDEDYSSIESLESDEV